MEFRPFPKLPRLNRNMVITEKLDGTNAAVVLREVPASIDRLPDEIARVYNGEREQTLGVWAQSRKRLIYIGKSHDNYGFAGWVKDHAEELAQLGPGHHYGEWWGQGIQRGYDLDEKRFSLFNAGRWADPNRADQADGKSLAPACCHVVPVLDTCAFDQGRINDALTRLREDGSKAAPGFMDPEGIVVYLAHARQMFKVTLKNDGVPKSAVAA